MRDAIAASAHVQPGASAIVRGVTFAQPLRGGDVVDAQADVTLAGNGVASDVHGTTGVHVQVDALPRLDPQVLFYSDDPEKVAADGVLYRSPIAIDRTRAARAYVYHVSDTPARRLALVLQPSGGASRVQILGATAGPSADFGYTGHVSTLRYMLERSVQESAIAALAAGAPYAIPLDDAAMNPGDLVAAIFDLQVLDGGPVTVSIVAASGGVDPLSLVAGPELPSDTHGRRGEFDLTLIPPLALAFTVGGPEPSPFLVGVPVFKNLRPGGRALGGDYGVVRAVELHVVNPTGTPQRVYLYETPAGGTATTTIRLGDAPPLSVACVDPSQSARYLVSEIALAANETRTIRGEYMTDGTSSFPLAFGLTSTAPATPPPTACGHAAPAPSPGQSAIPAASPIPSASPSPSQVPLGAPR